VQRAAVAVERRAAVAGVAGRAQRDAHVADAERGQRRVAVAAGQRFGVLAQQQQVEQAVGLVGGRGPGRTSARRSGVRCSGAAASGPAGSARRAARRRGTGGRRCTAAAAASRRRRVGGAQRGDEVVAAHRATKRLSRSCIWRLRAATTRACRRRPPPGAQLPGGRRSGTRPAPGVGRRPAVRGDRRGDALAQGRQRRFGPGRPTIACCRQPSSWLAAACEVGFGFDGEVAPQQGRRTGGRGSPWPLQQASASTARYSAGEAVVEAEWPRRRRHCARRAGRARSSAVRDDLEALLAGLLRFLHRWVGFVQARQHRLGGLGEPRLEHRVAGVEHRRRQRRGALHLGAQREPPLGDGFGEVRFLPVRRSGRRVDIAAAIGRPDSPV
jgi:hypothetical protein